MAGNRSEYVDIQNQVSELIMDEMGLAFQMADTLNKDKKIDISCEMTQAHLIGLKVNELNQQLIGEHENSGKHENSRKPQLETMFSVHSNQLNWQSLRVLFDDNNAELSLKCIEMLMACTNPNGKLSRNQLIQNCEQLFPNGKAKDFCKYAFAVFDRDNTGTIEFYEFVLAIGLTQSNDFILRFGIAFDMHNYNDIETMDVNELTKAITTLYDLNGVSDRKDDRDPKHRAEEIIRICDVPDNKITRKKFIYTCKDDPVLCRLLIPDV
ncbi:hypothetical protein I4U23_017212 [Adineta vaga]|nr:hypothetical protein I4U23_017212 [Adineta vaga]